MARRLSRLASSRRSGQVGKHRQVGAERVPAGGDPFRQHDRGVETLHVAFDHRPEDARGQQLGVAARVATGGLRGRDAVPVHQVGAQHQVVQLLPRAAGGDRLERPGQDLGLVELGRGGEVGEHLHVAHVVERVAQQAVAVAPPDLGDLRARHELPVRPGQPQLLDRLLQAVGGEMAADVVALNLLVGIDDVAAVDVRGRVRHRQRPGLETGVACSDAHR